MITKSKIKQIISNCGIWTYKNLQVDFSTYTAVVKGKIVVLTHFNMELLKLFLASIGKVLTRDLIKIKVWGYDSYAEDRNVDTQICLLRKKLGMTTRELMAVRSVGYKLVLN